VSELQGCGCHVQCPVELAGSKQSAFLSRSAPGNGTDRFSTVSPSHAAERAARAATIGSGICW
jgi:hypothetical protein